MGKKGFWGKDETNSNAETDDPAAAHSPHNEAIGQRPAEFAEDEEAQRQVRKQSESTAQRLTQGQTTTTTPDSVQGGTVQTRTVGELDAQSPSERLKTLRGWAKDVRLGGPRSADWEKFDEIVGAEESEEAAQSAAPQPKTGEDRRP